MKNRITHRFRLALTLVMGEIVILMLLSQVLGSCRMMRKSLTVQTYEKINYKSDSILYAPMIWVNDSVGGIWKEKVAFYISVRISGIEKELYMQFDLGAASSVLYENPLNAFTAENTELSKYLTDEKKKIYFKNAHITLNNNLDLYADKIPVYQGFGDDKIDSSFNVIGTIGFDILGDNILILDFKNNQYALTASIPSELEAKATFVADADLNYFPVILPFKLGEKKIRLIFDTGSSMFTIITGIKQLKKAAKGNKIDSLCCVHAWGKDYPYYKAEIADSLWLDNTNFGRIEMYGIKSMNKLSFIKKYVFGVTGNIMFDNSIVIIDRKNNMFGIVK